MPLKVIFALPVSPAPFEIERILCAVNAAQNAQPQL